ncbi:MAG: efflux RND transporter periplasmic adaptor subunit, partial [Pseudomonadota bacterium]
MRYKNTKQIWLGVLLTLVLSACGGGGQNSDAENAKKDDEEKEAAPVPVEVQTLTRGDVVAVYSGTATLEADQEAQVVAKVAGEVRELLVEEGDLVKANQVLARLDGDRLRYQMRQSRANLQKLEQDYNRNVDLFERGLISSGAFEGMKFELDALRAQYELARLELSYTEIRAPIDGVIAERFIKIGNNLNVNDPVFQLTDLDPLIAYLHVPEREFNKLQAKQPALIVLDALQDTQFVGEVARISPTIDPNTGTFKATIEVDDQTNRLKPGMFGRFNIVYDRHENAVLLPRSAVLDDDRRLSVFIAEERDGETVAKRRVIETGFPSGEKIEVTSGLDGSERVVVIGHGAARDDGKLEVVRSDGELVAKPKASDESEGTDGASND